MTKHRSAALQQSTGRPTPSGRTPLLRWTALVAALALAAFAGWVVLKAQWVPQYWSDDELGPVQVNATAVPGPAPKGMVWVPGGVFWMGSDEFEDAKPIHKVAVDSFWMDRTEVTNRQFAAFVEATGYVTVVERPLTTAKGTREEPFSLVFVAPQRPIDPQQCDVGEWWKAIPGACWKRPEGPGSDLQGREQHPVVHICYDDALAYAAWAKKRLPTEAEWEFAARGGLDRRRFVWGDEARPGGKYACNNWQGQFPHENLALDGFAGTAPVGSYPANGFGLVDMAGNVWEWCADWYQPRYDEGLGNKNPQGPPSSHDPQEPGVPKRVLRGGSFLCADNYCMRYLPGARGKGDPGSTGNHMGFRCVRSAP
jgi:formylglycine-generating enzyme required for sulfatase activity